MLIPFAPKPGIFPDETTYAAEGRWADCNNVRFSGGKAQVIEGWTSLFTLATATYGVTRAIFPFTRSGSVVIAYGTTRFNATGTVSLLVGSGQSAPSDRTPVGISASTPAWSLDSWGDILLACPHGGTLYQQSASSTATEVTEAPDRIDAGILVSDQRQVLAFAANEVGGTHNPMCIRVSNIEDYSSAGSWTPTATNNADEIILEGHGKIVGHKKVGPYIAVWTNQALYLGQYIGDPGQTYRFDKVAENCGLMGPMAVTVLNGQTFWMAADARIYTWAPGELPRIVPSPLQTRISQTLIFTYAANTVACGIAKTGEVWFSYHAAAFGGIAVAPSGTTSNFYTAFSVIDGTWFNGAAGRTAMTDSGLVASLNTTSAQSTIAAIAGAIYVHGGTYSGTTDSPLNPWIQSADFTLENSGRRMMIRGIRPDFEGQANPLFTPTGNENNDISLRLFVRSHPQSSSTTKGPYQLAAGATKKDFRASGKLVQVKLSSNAWAAGVETGTDQNGYFRLGKLLFDVVPLGER